MEHLAFHTRQGEHRQIDHHDDQLPEDEGSPRLAGGGEHFLEALPAIERPTVPFLGMSQPANGILHDHHGAIDDDAEVERTQTHQVGADPIRGHAAEGEEHRQRDHQRGDQRRAQIAEEDEEHGDDQQRTLHKILAYRSDRLVH